MEGTPSFATGKALVPNKGEPNVILPVVQQIPWYN